MAFWQWMGLAVAAAVLCMVVRAQQPQMADLCALAAGVMLLLAVLEGFGNVQAVFARLTGAGRAEGRLPFHACEGAGCELCCGAGRADVPGFGRGRAFHEGIAGGQAVRVLPYRAHALEPA